MSDPSHTAVAIIGAGPYGISVAAHLEASGIAFRIFGRPMYRWLRQMPRGMFLKSEGHASSLSDPHSTSTLARYCRERGIPYGDIGVPTPLEIFTQYTQWFQQSLTSTVEEVMVAGVDRAPEGFRLELSDGTIVPSSKVIVATGLEHMARIPSVLESIPSNLMSHSSDHHDLGRFEGKNLAVIGGGQSALELAALLTEVGASVRLVVRRPSLVWNPPPTVGRRSLYQRLRYPRSGLGDGLQSWCYCSVPALFRRLPPGTRLETAYSALGPSGAWWLKERVLDGVQVLVNHFLARVETAASSVLLEMVGPDGRRTDLVVDHVIAATGYRFDLQRLPFLSNSLKADVKTFQKQPILSLGYESSVHGLYFTGLASASSLGPAMRFLAGTDYTGRAISRHLAGRVRRYKGARTTFAYVGDNL